MIVTKKSILTGKVRQREIDISSAQLKEWEEGALIQNVMPDISVNDREFLISGITQQEWNEIYPED